METILIVNGDVLHAGRIEQCADVRIEGSKIAESGKGLEPGIASRLIDATGLYVLPGLIDIHNHGLRDVWVNRDDIHKYSRYQAENGVTACVATLAARPQQDSDRMRQILAETADLALTPNIVGFRPEILYLAKPGGADATALHKPDAALTKTLWEASGGRILIWDVSPEVQGAIPFIEWCAGRGIVTSMAHSSATIEQARRAVDAGLSMVTHFYDTFNQPVEVDPGVYLAGITDYIQVEDRVTAEIIPDGVHVHPLLVEKTLRCKGIGRVIVITDSLKGSGNPPGEYDGLIPGDNVAVTPDRGIRRKSDGALTGSAITVISAFRNAVIKFGRSIPEASQLCSANPARLLGIEKKGFLAAGMDADVILLDRDLRLVAMLVQGKAL